MLEDQGPVKVNLEPMLMSNQKEFLYIREKREPILGKKHRWKTTERDAANWLL